MKDLEKSVSEELGEILYALFQSSVEGILVVDPEAKIVMINPYCELLFGYEPDELLHQSLGQLIPTAKRSVHHGHFTTYFQQPQARPMGKGREFPGRKKNGEELFLEISLHPLELEEQAYVVAHVIDVTERRGVTQALEENQRLLKAIIDSAVDGILTIDRQGTIRTANPAAARLFGYAPEEMIGQNVKLLMPEPFHSEHDQYLRNYHQSGKKKIIGIGREVKGRKKDGTEFPFYLSVSEVKQVDQTIYAGVVHDLSKQKEAEAQLLAYSQDLEKRVLERTQDLAQAIETLEIEIQERKLIEEALRHSREELEQALFKEKELNELKSRFVSMASHEFRTPLATILSSVSLVDRYRMADEKVRQEKHIARIKSNVQHLTSILNDFLSLSKLEEGKVGHQPRSCELDALVQDLKEEFQGQLKPGQRIQYASKSPNPAIFLDPDLLKKILINLLSNAVKYSPEQTQIDIRAEHDEDTLIISVSDQGMGIPAEEQDHLFERFFRARNAANIQGTGLGLSIVKRYVDLMEGSISFRSQVGQGTTFILQLPIYQAPAS